MAKTNNTMYMVNVVVILIQRFIKLVFVCQHYSNFIAIRHKMNSSNFLAYSLIMMLNSYFVIELEMLSCSFEAMILQENVAINFVTFAYLIDKNCKKFRPRKFEAIRHWI